MPDARQEFLTAALPPALEPATAYSLSGTDPALFGQTMRRVVAESMDGADPTTAIAQLLFGLSALNGILVDGLVAQTGRSCGDILTDIARLYLTA